MLTRSLRHAAVFALAGSPLATAALADTIDDINKMNAWVNCIANAKTNYAIAYGACSSLISANPDPYNLCIAQAGIAYSQAIDACGPSPALRNGSSAVDTTGNTMHGITGGENGAQSNGNGQPSRVNGQSIYAPRGGNPSGDSGDNAHGHRHGGPHGSMPR